MLLSLHIRDLALIEAAELQFVPGLNVISGETGGGKSLVIAALALLRGEKASGHLVRHGASELRVDGEFALGEGDRARAVAAEVLQEIGAPPEGDVVLVTRIVDAAGRSRARINGRPATVAALRALGAHLLEIHGQHDARCLMRPEIQCETLDAFAGTTPLRAEFAAALAAARAVQERLAAATAVQRDRHQRVAMLRHQVDAMTALGLQDGEIARLEEEHRLLAHLDRQRELVQGALALLQDAEENASGLLGRARRHVREAAGIDRNLEDAAHQLAEAEMLVGEAVRALQHGLARLDLDPDRLAAVEDRLGEVRDALQRFGLDEAEWSSALAAAQEELARLTDESQQPEALAAELQAKLADAAEVGRRLVRARKKAVPGFCAAIAAELASLKMADTKLRVAMAEEVDPAQLLSTATAHGPSPVELLVRVNPGEPFHPLRDTASGGELARIVLAVKKCLADQDRVPFLVFDEIDAEIGGRLGLLVGRKLREVAAHHQVLIVTHLPQVAAFAQAHFKVCKSVVGGRTRSVVELLSPEAREAELAAMGSWDGADAAAVAEARRLVERAAEA
ncbi:MAG TPA: DNA repair protein RecN [Planctomycetota bacterium]|nr:DNA repair protein RecN [Planctomycetota bacterium]